jgi:ABC-type multidrug transport system ATPase subunit
MTDPVISLAHCKKEYGPRMVLRDVSLQLTKGTIFGLVGLNGAGKTTLLRLLLGLLRSDAGTYRVLGMDPMKHESRLFRRIGVVLEHSGFDDNCSVLENLHFFGKAKSIDRDQVDDYFTGWWKGSAIATADCKVKTLSRGQKMQCAICRAFLGWPEVFLFDEPVVALDMQAYDHFCSMARFAQSQGATIIISSHQLDAIEELCDMVGILQDGEITLLNQGKKATDETIWIFRASGHPEYGHIISEGAGSPANYQEGQWIVPIDDGQSTVPGIIARLVAAGCAISEVRPQRASTLKESIRKHFTMPERGA